MSVTWVINAPRCSMPVPGAPCSSIRPADNIHCDWGFSFGVHNSRWADQTYVVSDTRDFRTWHCQICSHRAHRTLLSNCLTDRFLKWIGDGQALSIMIPRQQSTQIKCLSTSDVPSRNVIRHTKMPSSNSIRSPKRNWRILINLTSCTHSDILQVCEKKRTRMAIIRKSSDRLREL